MKVHFLKKGSTFKIFIPIAMSAVENEGEDWIVIVTDPQQT